MTGGVQGRGGCVLHFGQHKTGSSSIQQSLSGAGDLGRYHCVRLGTPTGNASWPLILAFADEPWRQRAYRKFGVNEAEALAQRPAVRAMLADELLAAGARTAIISAEGLSRFTEGELANLSGRSRIESDRCGRSATSARREASWRAAFNSSCAAVSTDLISADLYASYRRFEVFETVLGRQNVSLWRFAPGEFPGGDVVRDFCARLGIEIPEHRIARVNESLSRPAVSILFAYRRFGPESRPGRKTVRLNRVLTDVLRTVPGPKLRFADSAVEPVLEENADDLAWIEERLGEQLADKPAADEGSIRTEEDLLEIEAAALRAFLDEVESLDGIELADSVTARLDTDPRAVAQTVAACAEAIRKRVDGPGRNLLRRRRRGGELPHPSGA